MALALLPSETLSEMRSDNLSCGGSIIGARGGGGGGDDDDDGGVGDEGGGDGGGDVWSAGNLCAPHLHSLRH